jgi:hypothetical protein
MPEQRPVASAHVAAIKRPRCPNCQQNRMLLSGLEAGGPSGIDRSKFECWKCGRVETAVISRDPMKFARGWLASELKPPT